MERRNEARRQGDQDWLEVSKKADKEAAAAEAKADKDARKVKVEAHRKAEEKWQVAAHKQFCDDAAMEKTTKDQNVKYKTLEVIESDFTKGISEMVADKETAVRE